VGASAWVLWVETSRLSAGVRASYWNITTIHTTQTECRAEIDRVIEEVAEQQRKAGAREVVRFDEDRLAYHYDARTFLRRAATTVRYLCLPHTVAPRATP
jgi:hypothetical protein